MKGMVFAEFIDLVEDQFGLETADHVIETAETSTGGAYTSIATYPHQEMVDLVVALSEKSGVPVADLQRAFGRHLLRRFAEMHPVFFEEPGNTFEFLASIESKIHVEVRKLHADVQLPHFTYRKADVSTMVMEYRSQRPFADLAHGLIEEAAAFYGETISIACTMVEDPGDLHYRFELTRTPAP